MALCRRRRQPTARFWRKGRHWSTLQTNDDVLKCERPRVCGPGTFDELDRL
jgi:hypothetical protein